MKAIIHFPRIGKPDASYTEGLVRDDERQLDTWAGTFPAQYLAKPEGRQGGSLD